LREMQLPASSLMTAIQVNTLATSYDAIQLTKGSNRGPELPTPRLV